MGKLQLPVVAKAYSDKLTFLLAQNTHSADNWEAQWSHISNSIGTRAKTVFSYVKSLRDETLYVEE